MRTLTLFTALTLTAFASAQQKHPAEEQGLKSKEELTATFVTFVNKTGMKVQVIWLDFEGKRVHYLTLEPNQEYKQQTYLTHPWLITDADGNALDLIMPTAEPRTVRLGRKG
jgi:hypothetical protein